MPTATVWSSTPTKGILIFGASIADGDKEVFLSKRIRAFIRTVVAADVVIWRCRRAILFRVTDFRPCHIGSNLAYSIGKLTSFANIQNPQTSYVEDMMPNTIENHFVCTR